MTDFPPRPDPHERRPPGDLCELVGDDVSAEELEGLRPVDGLLRSVPAPPGEVPRSLARAVAATAASPPSWWTRRRLVAAAALAAALSAASLTVGVLVASGTSPDGFDARITVPMRATTNAPGASGVIRIGGRDESGNWTIEFEVSGLPELPPGGAYALWLAKDGRYGAMCGYFKTGAGRTTVRMNGAYELPEFDTWVVTAHLPSDRPGTRKPWLLQAKVDA